MQKWEYCEVLISIQARIEEWCYCDSSGKDVQLNNLGREGWNLVGIAPLGRTSMLVFKRPLEEEWGDEESEVQVAEVQLVHS